MKNLLRQIAMQAKENMERGAFRARPLAENNKGMARKRYFPLFFPKQEKPYVSLALIANQAFNIFFDPFISGDQTVFGIKKEAGDSELESVSQFFHILGSVDQQRGCCEVAKGKYEITLYTSCCNTTKGIYYYTTYENHQINAVDMHRENLDTTVLIRYPVLAKQNICFQN